MATIGLKTLTNTVAKVNPTDRGLLSKQFNAYWQMYYEETLYWRTLWENGRISLGEYRNIAIPKLRNIRNELQKAAKTLISI
jgi:hypothetical protein